MARDFWWHRRLVEQYAFVTFFRLNIATFQTQLGLTAAQILEIQKVCDAFAEAYVFFEQSKMTMQGVTQWRDSLYYGQAVGKPAVAPPVFAVGSLPDATDGLVKQIFKWRDLIVNQSGYTTAIGETLGLIGPEKQNISPDLIAPDLKVKSEEGYSVHIKGSMQGMSMIRVDYRPAGGQFSPKGYFSMTPFVVTVNPTVPGSAEKGELRAVFIEKNEPFGQFSPIYPVTVS